MMYLEDSNLNDYQFLYIDLIVLVPLCIVQEWTGPYHRLTKDLPQCSLFSPPVLVSVIGLGIFQFLFQFWPYWVMDDMVDDDDFIDCEETDDDDWNA